MSLVLRLTIDSNTCPVNGSSTSKLTFLPQRNKGWTGSFNDWIPGLPSRWDHVEQIRHSKAFGIPQKGFLHFWMYTTQSRTFDILAITLLYLALSFLGFQGAGDSPHCHHLPAWFLLLFQLRTDRYSGDAASRLLWLPPRGKSWITAQPISP